MFGLKPAQLRKILAQRGSFEQCDQDVRSVPSPKGKHAVVFSHGYEVTMMNYQYFVTLFDGNTIASLLEPLRPVHAECVWSADSKRFALPVAWSDEAIFVYDVTKAIFCAIRVSTRRVKFSLKEAGLLHIQFDPEQLRMMNLNDGRSQMPVERFKAPKQVKVKLAEQIWYPEHDLKRLGELMPGFPMIDMEAITDGYFPFKGKFPASTTAQINGRKLEIFHLVAFADCGDAQSKKWLEEIRKKADKREISPWDPVSKYLGKQKRTV